MSDQQEIMQALHDHDRRLVKVETELHGLHKEVGVLRAQLESLIDHVGELKGSHKLILAIVGFGVPAIIALELWNRIIQ